MAANNQVGTGTILENPFNITAEMERLGPPRNVPFASESMFFQAWDRDQGIGVWTHLGSAADDHQLFIGETVIYLPGGGLLVDRSAGRAPDDLGPSSGNLTFRLEEPLRRWRVTFDGTAERTTSDEMAKRPGGSGRAEAAAIDLTFVGKSPVYDMYTALGHAGTEWGQLHHEQALVARGTLRYGGREYPFDGYGYRDHGRGTRNLEALGGDTMIFGVFPDGRAIGCLMAWKRDGTVAIEAGFLYDHRGYSNLGLVALPHLADRFGNPADVTGRFIDQWGEPIEINCTGLHQATFTLSDPNHWVIGYDASLDDPLIMVETPALLRWGDDTVGYGNVERNCRASQLGVVRSPTAKGA